MSNQPTVDNIANYNDGKAYNNYPKLNPNSDIFVRLNPASSKLSV